MPFEHFVLELFAGQYDMRSLSRLTGEVLPPPEDSGFAIKAGAHLQ